MRAQTLGMLAPLSAGSSCLKKRVSVEFRPGSFLLLAAGILLLPIQWLISLIVSGFVHEMGHLIMLVLCKVPIHAIVIGTSGAKIQTGPLSDLEQLLCSLAGPLAGLLAMWLLRPIPIAQFCCLIHSLFNLLPISGFDGGRALDALCSIIFGQTAGRTVCSVLRLLCFIAAALLLLTFCSKVVNYR